MEDWNTDMVNAWLRDPDPNRVSSCLRDLGRHPLAEASLLPLLAEMLEDRRLCIAFIPIHYAELRYMAGMALAAVRGALGIDEPVIVAHTLIPITGDQFMKLRIEARLSWQVSREQLIAELDARGTMPRFTKVFFPRVE